MLNNPAFYRNYLIITQDMAGLWGASRKFFFNCRLHKFIHPQPRYQATQLDIWTFRMTLMISTLAAKILREKCNDSETIRLL